MVCQSEPAEAILLAGSAWPRPYAPDDGFVAWMFQPDSRLMMLLKQANWSAGTMPAAIDWTEPEEYDGAWTLVVVGVGVGVGVDVCAAAGACAVYAGVALGAGVVSAWRCASRFAAAAAAARSAAVLSAAALSAAALSAAALVAAAASEDACAEAAEAEADAEAEDAEADAEAEADADAVTWSSEALVAASDATSAAAVCFWWGAVASALTPTATMAPVRAKVPVTARAETRPRFVLTILESLLLNFEVDFLW